MEIARVVFASDLEGIDRAGRAYPKGFDAKSRVVDGACRRGEVEDVVDLSGIEGASNVLLEKRKRASEER